MELSEKFPRLVLCSRKSILGVGLMSPSTIASSLALKLYVGHNRYKSELSKIMRINEENARLYYGYSSNVLNVKRELKPKIVIWSDEMQETLSRRELKFVNCVNERKWISQNKSIMDYAVMHVKHK